MNFLFLINALVCVCILAFLEIGFIRMKSHKSLVRILSYLSVIGIFYMLISLLSFLWFFKFLEYSADDFLILYSILIALQSFLLFRVIVLISKNKKLNYFLYFYFISLVSLLYSWYVFFNVLVILSFLLCLLYFIDLVFRKDIYKNLGYFGIFYSFLGVLFQILYLLGIANLFLLTLFLNMLFFILVYLFLKDLHKNPPELYNRIRDRAHILNVLGHMVFIIVLTNLIFVGTVVLHEFGHLSVAKLSGCEAGRIVYEKGYFHTEVLCKDESKNPFVLLGGIILPFILAISLFFIGGRFLKDIAILIIGFNLLSVSRDFSNLGFSDNLITMSIFFGIFSLIAGIILLSKSKVEEDIYLSPLSHK